ncbi:hypothetical protein IMX26_04680 [Clostridium sp. 'deep sea']|uniref:hypothetical protein n=1 Tax=Clostridium sp. 'deep sea' TaxID=2779445 RepID=UPI001896A2C4|nr:hypothetical protein [Clostridium sp. 'deep sea']QOR36115.1 hypothetical protein IMX26_04680 [Clostridium sp. 'deep sea']
MTNKQNNTGVSAVRNYIYTTFKNHQALSEENAVSLKTLGFEFKTYHYLEPQFNSYLKAKVINKSGDKYWLNAKNYKSYETKQIIIMLGFSGIVIALLFFLGKLILRIVN